MKRQQSNTDAGAHKRQRREMGTDLAPKITHVKSVLKEIEALPEDVRTMLGASFGSAASVEKLQRHEFQAEVLEMVGRGLSQEEHRLEAALLVAKGSLEDAEGTKAAAEKKLDDAKADFEGKVQAVAEQEAALGRAKQAQKDAGSALKTAQGEQENLAKDVKDLQKTSAAEWAVYTENLKVLRREPAEGEAQATAKMDGRVLKKHVGKVVDALKSAKADKSLIDSLPATFAKLPAERGEFDKLAWDTVEKIFTSRKAEADEKLARFEAGEAANAALAKVQACEAALSDAKSQVEKDDLELTTRNTARTDAEAAMKAAADETKGAEKKAKAATSAKESAEENLKTLQEAVRTFESLREYGAPTEQQQEITQEEAVIEAPLEAAIPLVTA